MKATIIMVFEDGEFDGKNVASIHNHPADVFSPPSGKNFGILMMFLKIQEYLKKM